MAGDEDVGTAAGGLLMFLWHVLCSWVKAVVMAFVPTCFVAKDISGQTVLITGAGSGIGRLLALEFADHNCRLVLWDVQESGNRETARLASALGAKVRAYTVDVSDRKQVYATADKVNTEMGRVDIVVNNAGVVSGPKFLDCPDRLVDRTMQVNTMAHFWVLKAFLPAMMARDHGHVVTVASSAGLIGVSGLADYCASKFAALGLAESLRQEMIVQGKHGVHTTVVCPYLISTGMFDGCSVKFPWLLNTLEPDFVAQEIVKAVLRNQEMLILPRLLYAFISLKGILPVNTITAICEYLGASRMMDTFKGRSGVR